MNNFDIFIFAAEDSADVFGEKLISEFLKQDPDKKILCVAGPRMRKHSISTLMKMEDFQVMGFTGILFSLFKLVKHFFFLKRTLLRINPKICIFIDYPDFNLRLEKQLRKGGFTNILVHYVAPTVWAWRKKRAVFMAKYIDLLITVFPFEKSYFSHTALDVRFVGHPLAEEIKKVSFCHLLDNSKNFIGLFPGSRKKEIEKNFPLQLKVAKMLLEKYPNLIFAVSCNNHTLTKKIFKKLKMSPNNFIFFGKDDNHKFMKQLFFAIATSGTITLELALHNIPTIVNYYVNWLDLFIIRKILKIELPYYCIVNIIAQKEIFYELYGPNLNVKNLFDLSKKLYLEETERQKKEAECVQIMEKLHQNNSNKLAIDHINSFLKKANVTLDNSY